MNRCGTIALLLLVSALPVAAPGDDPIGAKRKDLADVERALLDLEQDLRARRSSRSVLVAELERHERDVAQLARAGHQLDAMIEEQVHSLTTLQQELQSERDRLERERRSLAALLRSAYTLGGNEHIRMLLDQEDLAHMGRVMSYYGYLNRFRIRRLRDFAARAQRLEALRLEASEETQRLALLAARQKDTRKRLALAQSQRANLLLDLENTIAGREERLASLRDDAAGLRTLVEQLERQAAMLPEADVAQQRIAELRGRLAWPLTSGRLLERFGRAKRDSGQNWDGVLLAAPEGTEVLAVHHGRVAYADWLRGFGLLIIIEHDDGYMSLYGHNQTLFKEPGEWVETGEAIALSGASGGQRRAGLYFAIRHHGRPLNPERWCNSVRKLGYIGNPASQAGEGREPLRYASIKTRMTARTLAVPPTGTSLPLETTSCRYE